MNMKQRNNLKLVTIVIPTKNEAKVIERLMKSIKSQSYKNIEIVIVDNNSNDKTVDLARKFTNKVLSKGPERSAQRNFGARHSKGDYLLFLDADMRLTKNVVKDLVAVVSSEKNVGGVVIPERSVATTFMEQVKAFERSFYNENGDSVTDAARFFDKKVFLKVGGYDETITGPEDWDLPETIQEHGYKIKRINSFIFHYEKIPSLESIFKKKFYYGLKANRYLKKHKISPISAKTVYFLRPVFIRNWRRMLNNPKLALGLVVLLGVEMIGGGLGYVIGLIKNR